ncbi:MAG: hypothetical protein P9X24_04460 [Candidatus Hatepunaea meridiana]|nr:hypothetical protein [Candidatus Hatepunaea meridiana]
MSRSRINPDIEVKVLQACRRRCALCCYLNNDYQEKEGQIAHLNKKRDDNSFENLTFLCLRHHSIFDSTTSQHKNYTQAEIRTYKDKLTAHFESNRGFNYKKDEQEDIFSICFDGVNDFAFVDLCKPIQLSDLLIKIKFKISNRKYGGTLLSLQNGEYGNVLAVNYKFNDGEGDESDLKIYLNDRLSGEMRIHASLPVDNSWNTLTMTAEKKFISIKNNDCRTYTYGSFGNIQISRIELANYNYHKKIWRPLAGSFASVLVKDHSKNNVLYNFLFEHGREYFQKLPDNQDIVFINTGVRAAFEYEPEV